MPVNIDRVDISIKFQQKIDSISLPQRALELAGKGKVKRKIHPITGHESPEEELEL
jgi:hypothetical protein